MALHKDSLDNKPLEKKGGDKGRGLKHEGHRSERRLWQLSTPCCNRSRMQPLELHLGGLELTSYSMQHGPDTIGDQGPRRSTLS